MVLRIMLVSQVAAAALAGVVLAGCATTTETDRTVGSAGECPAEPVDVVVTVGQWSDLAETVAGACGRVTTVVGGASGDPHEYEPATSDAAHLSRAGLVVMNGLGYDEWASHVLGTLPQPPPVVDAAEAAGLHEGDDPHVWYGPGYVDRVADVLTAELEAQMPEASEYLGVQRASWAASTAPLHDTVASLRASAAGRTYAATEPVFDNMAAAVGLVDLTPAGYHDAAANEVDPSPGDVHAFDEALRSGQVDVLVHNTQTESALADHVLGTAAEAGVPVVEVTETVPPGATFVRWQIGQLDSLARALGQS